MYFLLFFCISFFQELKMILKSQILLFVITFGMWTLLRKYLQTIDVSPANKMAEHNEKNPSSVTHLLHGMDKIGNETEILNKAYKFLSFIVFHTKSSKSRIEYERAIGYFKKSIFRMAFHLKCYLRSRKKIKN